MSNDLVEKLREVIEDYESKVLKIGKDFDECTANDNYDDCLEIFERIGVRC